MAHPLGQVTGVALVEKLDGQPEEVAQKGVAAEQGQLILQPVQHPAPVGGEYPLEYGHPALQGAEARKPAAVALQEDLVDEELGEQGHQDPGHHQQQAQGGQGRQLLVLATEALPQEVGDGPGVFLPGDPSFRRKDRAMPVKASSSSAWLRRRRPAAGSLI